MKKLVYLIIIVLLFSCNSENAGDCFQTAGNIIQQELALDTFDKILVNRDVELIVKEGSTQKVIIETGKNLLNDVEVIVVDSKLILSDNNSCNYVRDYGITKVYVKPDAPKFIFVAAAIKPLSVFPVAPKLVPFQTDLVKV